MHRQIALALLALAAASEPARADWRVIDQNRYYQAVSQNNWLAIGHGGGAPGYTGYWVLCVDISNAAGWGGSPFQRRNLVVNMGRPQWVWQLPNWPLACQYARRTVAVQPPPQASHVTAPAVPTPGPTVYRPPPSATPPSPPPGRGGTGPANDPRGRVTGRGNSRVTPDDPNDPYAPLRRTGTGR